MVRFGEELPLTPLPSRPARAGNAVLVVGCAGEHLVLLDLLGAPHPQIRSYFPDTAWLFDSLISAESSLLSANVIGGEGGGGEGGDGQPAGLGRESFFRPRSAGERALGYMGDDHVPFLQRGVSVLHVIAEPFPRVWHTLGVRSFVFPSYHHVHRLLTDILRRTTRRLYTSRLCGGGTSSCAFSWCSI